MFRPLYGASGETPAGSQVDITQYTCRYSNPWSFYCERYEYERLLDVTHHTQPKTLDSVDCLQK